jgi:hypothetical protein
MKKSCWHCFRSLGYGVSGVCIVWDRTAGGSVCISLGYGVCCILGMAFSAEDTTTVSTIGLGSFRDTTRSNEVFRMNLSQ